MIHSVVTTAAKVNDLTPTADLVNGDEALVHALAGDTFEAVAGYQGIEKRPEMECSSVKFRVALRLCKRRAFPNTPEGRSDDWVKTGNALIRAKVKQPVRGMKQQ